MMLSLILLSVLIMQFPTQNLIVFSIEQLGLASEVKPKLTDTVCWGSKFLFTFDTWKFNFFSFDHSNSTGSIFVKTSGFGLDEKSSFKILEFSFTSEFDWASYFVSVD